MKVRLKGDWKLAKQLLAHAPQEIQEALKKSLKQEAHHFEAAVKRKIQAGPPPPLKNGKRFGKGGGKGGSKPLNATGDLLGSVTVVESGDGKRMFIGIPRSAKGHGGQVVRLAETHEFGKTIVIRLTEKMRRFLFGVLFKGRPSTGKGTSSKGFIIVRIPARPFVRPAFAEQAPGAGERFLKRLAKNLGGRYGTA
jgi:hypothetical protein